MNNEQLLFVIRHYFRLLLVRKLYIQSFAVNTTRMFDTSNTYILYMIYYLDLVKRINILLIEKWGVSYRDCNGPAVSCPHIRKLPFQNPLLRA